MNPKLRDLQIQAFAECKTFEDGQFRTDEVFQRFAELIVRECVEQCNVNFVGTVGSHPSAHNRGVKKCIDNIKEHFGVLE